MLGIKRIYSVILAGLVGILPIKGHAVPAEGHQIMVAGPSPHAIEVGRAIHLRGGNTVDVAVAVALSLAVTHPYYAAFGGGGFAIVKMNSEVKAIDFREMAPGKAHPDLYKDKAKDASITGGLAVGVPGVPAGLWALHEKYGKLKWAQLFPEAIALAEKGFRVSGEWVEETEFTMKRFNPEGKAIFSKAGTSLKPGEVLKQPGLARFMKSLQKQGPRAFYEGEVAKELSDIVQKNGGVITVEDLKNYRVRWMDPIKADYAGHRLYLMPPPSSGGLIIAQAVQLMTRLKLSEKAPLSVDELHLLIEIMKLSYRGRTLLGDPDFSKNPMEELLSEKYLASLAAKVKMDKALDVEPLREISFEKEQTTHFSVMDAKGNAVAFTVTLNGGYGSGVVTPRSGIALNNEMDDFTTRPGQPNMFGLIQGETNRVQARARPLSSMSPTIVEKEGRTILAVGSPGGPRIISAVMQVLHRSLTQPFDIDQAIQAPRVHHQFLPNTVKTDAMRLPPETIEALRARGHKIETGSTAKVYGVRLSPEGLLSGAADARGEGAAGGI